MNKKWLFALVLVAPIAQAQLFGSSDNGGLETNLCSSSSPSLTSNPSASAILSSLCASGSAMASAISSQGGQKDAGMLHRITQMVLGKHSAVNNAVVASAQQPSPATPPAATPAAPTPAAPASNKAGIYGYS